MKYHKLLQTLVQQEGCVDIDHYNELLGEIICLTENSKVKDKYLVIHLMNDSIYNQKLINRIKENSVNSNREHIYLFVESELKYVKHESNFIFYSNLKDALNYLIKADIILVQFLFPFYIDLLLNSAIHADMFWMPWAGDYVGYSEIQLIDPRELRLLGKRGINLDLKPNRHPKMKAFLDRLNLIICGSAVYQFIKDIFPTTTLRHMNHYFHQDVVEIENQKVNEQERETLEKYANTINKSLIKIILGNSGDLTNNYLMAIEFLAQSPLSDQLHITLMSSYGKSDNYDLLVKSQLKQYFPNRSTVFEDFLSPNAFIEFAAHHDAVFMFHNRPQGLGAISIYLALGMPVYMWPHNLCFGYLKSLRASVKGLHQLKTPSELKEIPTKNKEFGSLNVHLLREEITYSDNRLMSILS